MAKTFTTEEDIVKLQTVNLAAKLYLTNSKQVQNNTQAPRVYWIGHRTWHVDDKYLKIYHSYALHSSALNAQFKYRDANETGQL